MDVIRVNMADQNISFEELPKDLKGWGGRGLTSLMINKEVDPTCDPLGPENKLIIAPGALSGTSLVNTSRVSIGAKSPLTGTIKESNAGGTIGAMLGRMGIACIVIEGQPASDNLYLLKIDQNGTPELIPADNYKGSRTYSLTQSLFDTYGEKHAILCIGPAGEYQLKSASVQSTDVDNRPCRAAGRGGMGAVMGSKGIKAILIEKGGPIKVSVADPDTFKKAGKAFAEALMEFPFTGQMLPAVGTAGLVGAVNSIGAFPTLNATQGTMDGWENISGEALAKTIEERKGIAAHMGCSQCVVRCSNEYVDADGKYMTSSLEYETIWAMGAMTGIADLDVIARMDYLCDDIGLDTMNTGVAIGVAMDAGHKEFGDGPAALDMLEEVAQGTEFGKILGHGPDDVGKHFNHYRVPTVKGQSIAAYDPRGMQGNAVTYATSPMGADHTAGNLVGAYLNGILDPLKRDGQVEASRNAQIGMVLVDWTGMCLLAGAVLNVPEAKEAFLTAINARLGTDFTHDDLVQRSIQVLKAEREFNKNAGFTAKDDRMPDYFYKEPLPPHNKVVLMTDEDMDSVFDF